MQFGNDGCISTYMHSPSILHTLTHISTLWLWVVTWIAGIEWRKDLHCTAVDCLCLSKTHILKPNPQCNNIKNWGYKRWLLYKGFTDMSEFAHSQKKPKAACEDVVSWCYLQGRECALAKYLICQCSALGLASLQNCAP
jgi:hypothetical protein